MPRTANASPSTPMPNQLITNQAHLFTGYSERIIGRRIGCARCNVYYCLCNPKTILNEKPGCPPSALKCVSVIPQQKDEVERKLTNKTKEGNVDGVR